MFEFFLNIRVSFLLVGAGRMPRRCAATVAQLLDFLDLNTAYRMDQNRTHKLGICGPKCELNWFALTSSFRLNMDWNKKKETDRCTDQLKWCGPTHGLDEYQSKFRTNQNAPSQQSTNVVSRDLFVSVRSV